MWEKLNATSLVSTVAKCRAAQTRAIGKDAWKKNRIEIENVMGEDVPE